jgi:hypothetical protein
MIHLKDLTFVFDYQAMKRRDRTNDDALLFRALVSIPIRHIYTNQPGNNGNSSYPL